MENKFCTKCNRPNPSQYNQCDHCRLVKNKCSLERYHRIRLDIFEMYGGRCICCGENNPYFLTLDHKDNGGNKERATTHNDGISIYLDVKKTGYRDDLQLLCMNCNFGKFRNKGVCPHKGIIEVKDRYDIPEASPKPSKASNKCLICGKPRSEFAGKSARCFEHRHTRLDGGHYERDKPSRSKIVVEEGSHMKTNGNDDCIPAGDGIKPDTSELTPASWPGVTGSKGPGNDARIPAGDGIKPDGKAPFGQ